MEPRPFVERHLYALNRYLLCVQLKYYHLGSCIILSPDGATLCRFGY
uniref:Uncharacterized protein n=1 Tax=Lepeophtheirus salmonis TaxID=72036 RepID=A0A0K2UMI4_LEPSM